MKQNLLNQCTCHLLLTKTLQKFRSFILYINSGKPRLLDTEQAWWFCLQSVLEPDCRCAGVQFLTCPLLKIAQYKKVSMFWIFASRKLERLMMIISLIRIYLRNLPTNNNSCNVRKKYLKKSIHFKPDEFSSNGWQKFIRV